MTPTATTTAAEPSTSPRARPPRRSLSLRTRLALMSAAAVAIAIAVVSVVAWLSTAQALRSQVDAALLGGPPGERSGERPGERPGRDRPADALSTFDPEVLCQSRPELMTRVQNAIGATQLVRADGSTCTPVGSARLPVEEQDVAVARGGRATGVRDMTSSTGAHVRVITRPLSDGYAIMISRDLTEIDNTLRSLSLVLLLTSGLGVLGALSAGLVVARSGLRPVDELTRAAEHVAATTKLDVPIGVTGDDEVARLARAFNKMTAALSAARRRQHEMVADASHELRTPLTSLRTNVELLLRSEGSQRPLPAADRAELLHSLSAQLEELSHLANELSLLAHEDPAKEPAELRLDDVVRRAVERASRRGAHTFVTELEPWVVLGDGAGLERAVLNVLDNAVKFSPPASQVQVSLHGGLLEVADQGLGIPETEREQVFERFWRSPSSRSMPGSGLGLAIVADVAAAHGGHVSASTRPPGGAVVSMRLPGRAPAH